MEIGYGFQCVNKTRKHGMKFVMSKETLSGIVPGAG